jgi:hypothetical protein
MSFNNDEDEELLQAIQASLEDMKQTIIHSSDESEIETSSDESEIETSSDEADIDTVSDDEEIETSSDDEEVQQRAIVSNVSNESNENDDDITIAIQTSLVDYQTTEDNLLNDIIKKSLDSVEDDKKRKLEKDKQLQKEEDKLLSKVIEESYLSNISIQTNTSSVISNNENRYDDDYEEQYMNMILQQIKEQEEKDSKTKKLKQMRTIREEQDSEYEASLQKDIEKEQEQKKEKEKHLIKPINHLNSIINNSSDINTHLENESETKSKHNEDEKPKSLDDIRKARLAFFEKK